MGFETPEEGYLAKILIQAGEKDIPIGKLVCIIVENEADVAAFAGFKDTGAAAPKAAAAPAAPSSAAAPIPVAAAPAEPRPLTAVEQRGPRVYASPMAKRLAEAQQLRLEGRGSGVFESITSKDLGSLGSAAASAPAAPIATGAAYVDIPVSNTRAVIAKRLLESKVTIPHYYLNVDINIDKLVDVRNKFNKRLEKDGVKLSFNDFVVKATALASKKVPEANSSWHGSFIRQ